MGMPPDVSTVTRNGAVKYGFGLNFEQPLSADSATGLFGRLGWNDGSTESFMYTDCDRFLSFGLQVGGSWWKRKDDRVGVALAQSDLSSTHAQYLEAGGMGLDVGDGALSYGSERILESYYSYQISKPASVSLDLQYIQNPGYNRDRGPATLLAARLHYAF
jgi:carbohydrate-selective porin OprB